MAARKSNNANTTAKTKPVSGAKRRIRRRPVQYRGQQAVGAAANVGMVFTTPTNRIRSLPSGQVVIANKEIVLTITATPTAGVIPANYDVVTVSLSSSGFAWLSKFSDIYDKFVFKSLKLTWVPILPTTTSGSIAIYYESDDNVASGTFSVAASNERALVTPIFQQATTMVPRHLISALPWYSASIDTTGSNVQGYIRAAYTSIVLLNSAAATSTTVGYVMVDYIVHLKNATSG